MTVYIWTSWTLQNAYIGELYPESIELDRNSISLTTIWQTVQLTATVEPEDAPRRNVISWTSSDTTIATVDTSWLVTCVTPWECTITATTVNGLTASCSVVQSRLPSAYQEVEWVWSSRTQVINTGVYPSTQTYTAELEFESTQSWTEYRAFWIWGNTWFRSWQDSSWHWDTSFWASYTPSTYALNTRTTSYVSNASAWTSSNTALGLFWMWENWSYSNSRKWAYNIYYCKIWNNSVLIRDFIPCYRIADGVIWMYDLVDNQFYTNAGSWTFTKGNDV